MLLLPLWVAVIERKLQAVFFETKFWYPAFLIKPSGENTEFELHQDWTFVDEEKYYSGNVWIPLCETEFENGTLCIIPRAHYKNIKTLRSRTVLEIFKGREELLKKFCVPVNLKKGQAVIFQHSVPHYTPSNTSQKMRIAVACGFNSLHAPLLNYCKTENGSIEIYSMPDNFVFDYDNVEQTALTPNGKLIGHCPYKSDDYLTDEELVSLFSQG